MELFGRPVIETGSEKPPEIVFESWKDFWERKAREKAMSEKGIDPDSKEARKFWTNVTSITEVIEESTLPDGEYEGVWGGYLVRLKVNGHCYELKTDKGIRTMAAPCTVIVEDGKAKVMA